MWHAACPSRFVSHGMRPLRRLLFRPFPPQLFHDFGQALPVNQFHGVIVNATLAPHRVHADDVRVF